MPPARLLFLHQVRPSAEIAEEIGMIAARCLPRSPAYQRDVFTVWQRHSGSAIRTVGEFRLFYARKHLAGHVSHECPRFAAAEVRRLVQLLAEFCVHTTLSRSGDAFVKTCVASILPADVAAGLGTTETPYAAAAQVIPADYNAWVGSLYKTTLGERYARTAWRTSIAPVDAVFIFSLIFETLVTERAHRVLLEHELALEGNDQFPAVVLLNGRPVVCWNTTIWAVPDGYEHPLVHLALLWVKLAAVAGEEGTAVLNLCFAAPERVGSREPIYNWLKNSVLARAEETAGVPAQAGPAEVV